MRAYLNEARFLDCTDFTEEEPSVWILKEGVFELTWQEFLEAMYS